MMLASASTRSRSLAEAAPELSSKIVAVIDHALAYRKADRWPDVATMRKAWQEAHPDWLPTLPPPRFDADPSFLDTALLEPDTGMTVRSSLFDPRELVQEPHPGPPAKKR
jgi:serine/threonine-protein kinase